MGHDIQQQLNELRAEVRRLSAAADVQEITQLIMTYGPLVDSGSAIATADLWTVDGLYEVDGVLSMQGREQIEAMVHSPRHQGYITNGAGHVLTAPRVYTNGDTAEAFNHALLITLSDGSYQVARITANQWFLHRTDACWRVVRRVNRPLDGRASSRELFAQMADLG